MSNSPRDAADESIMAPMGLLSRHKKFLAETDLLYKSVGEVVCPFFGKAVTFNSDGFHHLQFSADRERGKPEQMLKFTLFKKYAVEILKNSGTVQEYRKTMEPGGKRRYSRKEADMINAEYWGFVSIVGAEGSKERVKVIVRRVGTGNPHFWSVMPAQHHRGDESYLQHGGPDMQDG